VAHIVKKYYSTSDEQDDLISIGTIGLIKAVNTFDDSKNIKIATYASKCIENEILMFMRSRKKSAHDISINEPIDTDGEGNPLTLMDIISVEDTIADDIDQKIKVKRLYELVEDMTDPRERSILIMRYGLYSTDPMTQRQIASRLGISRSYVSRIEKKAIERLREGFGE
jgi:RNA polymerase sporulation-specific sigma factor